MWYFISRNIRMGSYMQALSSERLTSNDVFKSYFNKKSVKFLMQLALLTVVLYCCLDNGLINELRSTLDIMGVKDTNRIIMEIGLPIKSLLDSLQFANFLFIIFKILITVIVLPIVFIFFVKTVARVKKPKQKYKYDTTSNDTANFGAVYIINSKFLC